MTTFASEIVSPLRGQGALMVGFIVLWDHLPKQVKRFMLMNEMNHCIKDPSCQFFRG
jgi:hypothetical protein